MQGHLGERRQPLALVVRVAPLTGWTRRGCVIEGGIETQTGDHGGPGGHLGKPVPRTVAVVRHQAMLALGPPMLDPRDRMGRTTQTRLATAPSVCIIPRRGRQDRQKRSHPHSLGPGPRGSHHQTDPTQSDRNVSADLQVVDEALTLVASNGEQRITPEPYRLHRDLLLARPDARAE